MEREEGQGAYDAGPAMNILDQALSVVELAESDRGRVSVTLDLDRPEHRAALAAALAVLQAMGEDPEGVLAGEEGGTRLGVPRAAPPPDEPLDGDETGGEDDSPEDAELRRSYATAISALNPDPQRQAIVVRETFPLVRELLQDGANVEAVAQIQYRRWLEEHPGSGRQN
jgi:hypothetical protein